MKFLKIFIKIIKNLGKDVAVVSREEGLKGHRTLVKGFHPTGMLDIASKCHVDLLLTKQHPCVCKESEGGFSPRYILVSFQTQTPSSDKPKSDRPVWNKATPTPDRSEKILPIKEIG